MSAYPVFGFHQPLGDMLGAIVDIPEQKRNGEILVVLEDPEFVINQYIVLPWGIWHFKAFVI